VSARPTAYGQLSRGLIRLADGLAPRKEEGRQAEQDLVDEGQHVRDEQVGDEEDGREEQQVGRAELRRETEQRREKRAEKPGHEEIIAASGSGLQTLADARQPPGSRNPGRDLPVTPLIYSLPP